jgi:hypothetical protein
MQEQLLEEQLIVGHKFATLSKWGLPFVVEVVFEISMESWKKRLLMFQVLLHQDTWSVLLNRLKTSTLGSSTPTVWSSGQPCEELSLSLQSKAEKECTDTGLIADRFMVLFEKKNHTRQRLKDWGDKIWQAD